jgi:hypothetical protein
MASPIHKVLQFSPAKLTNLMPPIPSTESSPDLARVVATSKRIELTYRLVGDYGNALGPPEGDWSEVAGIFERAFSTVHTVELSPPYLIVRFAKLPPSLWPFTISGLPLRFTDSKHGGHFNPGVLGRGKKELQIINLRWGDKLTKPVFKQALAVIQAQGIKVYEIFCFDGYWSIAISDNKDLERVPRVLVGQACCYRFESEILNSD